MEKLRVTKDKRLYLNEIKIRKNFLRCKTTNLYSNFVNMTVLKCKIVKFKCEQSESLSLKFGENICN